MIHLFNNWNSIVSKINKAGLVFLFLDYDGTLTPIVSTPDKAVMNDDIRKLLVLLSHNKKFKIAVISGRSLEDVKSKVSIDGIFYAGNHGLEIQGGGLDYLHQGCKNVRSRLKAIEHKLKTKLAHIKGIIAEDKGFSLSLHYRMADEKYIFQIKQIVNEVCNPYIEKEQIKLTQGKKVFEVRPPVDWGKGQALSLLREFCEDDYDYEDNYYDGYDDDITDNFTIYIGDDRTDEDAFKVLTHTEDISVLVGHNKASYAKFFLNNVDEVREFLTKII